MADGIPLHARAERVYVIVLNWNGWRDTIECLESIFRIDYSNYKVVVCDNGSSDGSWEQIRRWARGELQAEAESPTLAPLTHPPVSKPIPLVELGLADANTGIAAIDGGLVLVQTGANLGFAGGNNIGLRYALNRGDCEFAWLVNNDAVVAPDALSHLLQRMRECPRAGICGSTLLYYDDPSKVQAFGGSVYNRWLARGGHIGSLADATQVPPAETVENKMAYVVGASMLVRRSFLEQIGLINEEYFLYFDEIDWATRAKGRFQLAFAPNSVVYHKEGGITGSHRTRSRRSPWSEFFTFRSRVLFTRKYYPLALPGVLCAIGLGALYRMANFRWKNLAALVRGVSQGLSVPKKAVERQP